MTRRRIRTVAELEQLVGREIGVGEWVEIAQDRVDLFADATGDHLWIHVDTERVARSEFPATIAHGFLILSMTAILKGYEIEFPTRHAFNYGMDRVRFPAPVYVGDRVRFRSRVAALDHVAADQIRVHFEHVAEIEGRDKPGCVSRNIILYVLDGAPGGAAAPG